MPNDEGPTAPRFDPVAGPDTAGVIAVPASQTKTQARRAGFALGKPPTARIQTGRFPGRGYGNDPRHGGPCACADGGCCRGIDAGHVPWRRQHSAAGQGDKESPPKAAKPLPAKATQELPPELLALLRQRKMPKHSPILVRIFKEEAELEVWKQDATGRFQFLKVYPICRWSGDLGPKLYEGDRQAPEGFYTVDARADESQFQLLSGDQHRLPQQLRQGEQPRRQPADDPRRLLVSGCYAMTDEQISEIYSLARDSLVGRPSFQVQAYPFRLTPANLARHRNHPELAFWQMLKIGNDHFFATRLEPKVDVCNRRYVFDAQPPPNSPAPLVFNPTGKCPDFVVNPKIARPALEKQRADELEYAQLLEDEVPTVPIYSGLDGGMNAFFVPWYPGRITLSEVLPYASYLPHLPPIRWVDNDGSVTSKMFGTVF